LEASNRCDERGQINDLLRREGLYSPHLTDWRRQRTSGQLPALTFKKRGCKKDEHAAEMAALRRENERLRTQLTQAELIIAAQKKLSQALEALTCAPNGVCRRRRGPVMQTIQDLSTEMSVSRAYAALAVPRSRFYRPRRVRSELRAPNHCRAR